MNRRGPSRTASTRPCRLGTITTVLIVGLMVMMVIGIVITSAGKRQLAPYLRGAAPDAKSAEPPAQFSYAVNEGESLGRQAGAAPLAQLDSAGGRAAQTTGAQVLTPPRSLTQEDGPSISVNVFQGGGVSIPAFVVLWTPGTPPNSKVTPYRFRNLTVDVPYYIGVARARSGIDGFAWGMADEVVSEIILSKATERVINVVINSGEDGAVVVALRDSNQLPIPGSEVRIRRQPKGRGMEFDGPGLSTTTDSQGIARFFDIIPGRYVSIAEERIASEPFSLSPSQVAQVELSTRGFVELRGRIVCAIDPVPGATVSVYSQTHAKSFSTKSSTDGVFRLLVPKEDQLGYKLAVLKAGFIPTEQAAKEDEFLTLEVTPESSATTVRLHLAITVPSGRSIPAALVIALGSANGEIRHYHAKESANGEFFIEIQLPPHTQWTAQVQAADYLPVALPTISVGGPTIRTSLFLTPLQ